MLAYEADKYEKYDDKELQQEINYGESFMLSILHLVNCEDEVSNDTLCPLNVEEL